MAGSLINKAHVRQFILLWRRSVTGVWPEMRAHPKWVQIPTRRLRHAWRGESRRAGGVDCK